MGHFDPSVVHDPKVSVRLSHYNTERIAKVTTADFVGSWLLFALCFPLRFPRNWFTQIVSKWIKDIIHIKKQ